MIESEGLHERACLIGAVPSDELLSYTAGATIGVAPIVGTSLNQYYAAPNKLFSIWRWVCRSWFRDCPCSEQVVMEHEVGLIFEPGDVVGLAAAINLLLSDSDLYERCHRNAVAASKIFNWENESSSSGFMRTWFQGRLRPRLYPSPRWPAPTPTKRPRDRSRRSSAPTTSASSPTRGSRSSRSTMPTMTSPRACRSASASPGSYPYTRGIHSGMYRDRLWTMRQYAGYATAEETNKRYRYLIEHGSTGLSMAFDLPTQLGRDSDDPLCRGEVGRTGVAIDTIEDMRICLRPDPAGQGLDLDDDQRPGGDPAAALRTGRRGAGRARDKLRGTVQNDVLKEYVARGNYIYPPEPTMRLTTDIFAYCHENVPKWNTISISGYHIREKGCSAVQEVAFTLANAIAYVEAGLAAGLEIDEFGQRLAFFFNCHNNVFQEIAKFRAARRMWAEIMRERFGATDERALKIRFHTQTGGVTLQAQQPEVNIIRVALQGFAAVCGGTQSLHTNGFDEALALPTERSARIALRTQQVLAHESGAADTADPFAGSYFIESLTDEIEERAWELMDKVEELGGSVQALEFIQREIEESAFGYQERYRTGQDIIVGVNKYVTDTIDDVDILKVDPESEQRQLARLAKFKAARDGPSWSAAWRRCATSPAARATCSIRSRTRCAPAPRSARSAARCATSSASTRAARSSDERRSRDPRLAGAGYWGSKLARERLRGRWLPALIADPDETRRGAVERYPRERADPASVEELVTADDGGGNPGDARLAARRPRAAGAGGRQARAGREAARLSVAEARSAVRWRSRRA